MTTLSEDLKKLREMKLQTEQAKKHAEDLSREFKLAERRVFDRMEAEDCQSQKVGNVTYVRSSTTYAQVQDEGAFRQWAEESGLAEELFSAKPRKKLLNELVREYLDNSQPLPDGVGFYSQDYVAQRGTAA